MQLCMFLVVLTSTDKSEILTIIKTAVSIWGREKITLSTTWGKKTWFQLEFLWKCPKRMYILHCSVLWKQLSLVLQIERIWKVSVFGSSFYLRIFVSGYWDWRSSYHFQSPCCTPMLFTYSDFWQWAMICSNFLWLLERRQMSNDI